MRHQHSPTVIRHHERMLSKLQPTHDGLGAHWVYQQINDLESLRTFMASHIFAVWDFMTLLKTLQQRLTCVQTPWFPAEDSESARLINEIVLCEETDEIQPGLYMSHFELYLSAMQEVGADRGPIDMLLERLAEGAEPEDAVIDLDVPQGTRDFVVHTLRQAKHGTTPEVAAAFLHGREHVIPDMFKQLLSQPVLGAGRSPAMGEHLRRWLRQVRKAVGPRGLGLTQSTVGPGPNALRLYLERHIELDGEDHGPMAAQLLMNLCDKDRDHWTQAETAALSALQARHHMWDGVAKQIVGGQSHGYEPRRETPVISLAWGRVRKARRD
jgi:hypothetical protein